MKYLAYLFATVSIAVLAFVIVRFADLPEPVLVHLDPGPPQPRVPPAEAGIDPVALEQAAEYAAARGSTALLVTHGGHVVFEKYWGDTTADSMVELGGFAPALTALAVGGAINDRLIAGIEMPVARYLPDATPDDATTVRQLLALPPGGERAATDVALLTRLLEAVTGQSYEVLLTERLWKPMGAGEFSLTRWARGPEAGSVRGDCCLRMRVGDVMRLGELLTHDGIFEGNQFAPPGYVTQMLSPVAKGASHGFFTRVDGTFATHDVARLEAEGSQRLWVVPSLRLSILRIGRNPGGKGWDEAMIPDTIIRGTQGWQPAGPGESVDPNRFAPH